MTTPVLPCTSNRHGSTVAAWAWGCRCEPARAAMRRYEKGRALDRLKGRPRTVDATGTVRRLQALNALGWTNSDIAQRMGITGFRPGESVTRFKQKTRVRTTTAELVARVYDELSMTPGPSEITRKRALQAGWLPPLAYDDDELDLPDSTGISEIARQRVHRNRRRSEVDDVSVSLCTEGRLPGHDLNAREREEAVRILHQKGMGDPAIAARMGITDRTVMRIRQRLDIPANDDPGGALAKQSARQLISMADHGQVAS